MISWKIILNEMIPKIVYSCCLALPSVCAYVGELPQVAGIPIVDSKVLLFKEENKMTWR